MHTFLFSDTVIQGSPSEGLLFVFKYFWEVEKLWGLLILVLFFSSLGLIVYKKNKDNISDLKEYKERLLAY